MAKGTISGQEENADNEREFGLARNFSDMSTKGSVDAAMKEMAIYMKLLYEEVKKGGGVSGAGVTQGRQPGAPKGRLKALDEEAEKKQYSRLNLLTRTTEIVADEFNKTMKEGQKSVQEFKSFMGNIRDPIKGTEKLIDNILGGVFGFLKRLGGSLWSRMRGDFNKPKTKSTATAKAKSFMPDSDGSAQVTGSQTFGIDLSFLDKIGIPDASMEAGFGMSSLSPEAGSGSFSVSEGAGVSGSTFQDLFAVPTGVEDEEEVMDFDQLQKSLAFMQVTFYRNPSQSILGRWMSSTFGGEGEGAAEADAEDASSGSVGWLIPLLAAAFFLLKDRIMEAIENFKIGNIFEGILDILLGDFSPEDLLGEILLKIAGSALIGGAAGGAIGFALGGPAGAAVGALVGALITSVASAIKAYFETGGFDKWVQDSMKNANQSYQDLIDVGIAGENSAMRDYINADLQAIQDAKTNFGKWWYTSDLNLVQHQMERMKNREEKRIAKQEEQSLVLTQAVGQMQDKLIEVGLPADFFEDELQEIDAVKEETSKEKKAANKALKKAIRKFKWSEFTSGVTESVKGVTGSISEFWTEKVKPIIDKILSPFKKIGAVFKNLFSIFQKDDTSEDVEGGEEELTSNFDKMKSAITGFIEKLTGPFKDIREKIEDVKSKVKSWFGDDEEDIEESTAEEEGKKSLKEIVLGIWDKVLAFISPVVEWINLHIIEPIKAFAERMEEKLKPLKETIAEIKSVLGIETEEGEKTYTYAELEELYGEGNVTFVSGSADSMAGSATTVAVEMAGAESRIFTSGDGGFSMVQ